MEGEITRDKRCPVHIGAPRPLIQKLVQACNNFGGRALCSKARGFRFQKRARFKTVAQARMANPIQTARSIGGRAHIGARSLPRFQHSLRHQRAHSLTHRAPAEAKPRGEICFVGQFLAHHPAA